MNRESRIVAAAFMLLAAIAPQPVPAAHTPPAQPPEQVAEGSDVPRHTPVTRSERPAPQTVVVQAGDTYSRWAVAFCGTFQAWPGIQAANRWPERAIPVGATAVIACHTTTPAPVTAAKPAAPARVSTPKPGAAWVHPLASGKTATSSGSCWGAARKGHSHKGVDLAQPKGTPIRAVAAGTVYRKAYEGGGAGYYVVIRHAGSVFTVYMHMRSASPLSVDAHVITGQTVGNVGESGNARGPHLHFEVHRGGFGAPVNPAPFMRSHAVSIGC